jgi:hypothetical protein
MTITYALMEKFELACNSQGPTFAETHQSAAPAPSSDPEAAA